MTIRKRGRPAQVLKLNTPEKHIANSFKYHTPECTAILSGLIGDSVKAVYYAVNYFISKYHHVITLSLNFALPIIHRWLKRNVSSGHDRGTVLSECEGFFM